ncbi:MAG: TraG/TraD/VirD4 family protein [Pseudomonadota bacterium]
MEIYPRGGPLEHITSKTTFSFADLKRKKLTVYLVVDYANQAAAGSWAGLMQWMATWELVQAKNIKPVYMLLDEFANAPVHSLPAQLTLLRQYGVRCIMATQDLDDITRVYGKHALKTVLSEADIKQFLGGIRSQTTLDYISKYMGNSTERASNYAYGQEGLQESVSHTAKPILTPDEIRRLDKRSQIVFIGNLKPAILHKVQVFAIRPWRRQIGITTMYSKKRYLLPVEVRLRWWGTEVTRRGVQPAPRRPSTWPRWITLVGKLMPGAWVFMVLAALYAASEEGVPHLRVSYSYSGPYSARVFTECHYVGARRFTTYGPSCPVIVFEKPNRR